MKALATSLLGTMIALAVAAGTHSANRLDGIGSRYAGERVEVVCQRHGVEGEALFTQHRIVLKQRQVCQPVLTGPRHRAFVPALQTLLHEAAHFWVQPRDGDDVEFRTDCRAMRTYKDALQRFWNIRGGRAKAMYQEAWNGSLCRQWASLPVSG